MNISDLQRRHLLIASVSAAFSTIPFARLHAKTRDSASAHFAALEQRVGGRIGVYALDTASGAHIGHRVDERFGMCSTFKLPLAAAILRTVDQGRLRHDQFVPFTKRDLVAHSPVTRDNLAAGGMTVIELAKAAQMESDNGAANLLLALLGGPAGFTAILRELGDTKTRLDRYEPHMNLLLNGDPRDTTTPAAMSQTIRTMLTSAWLAPASRELLISWMIATETGRKRLRAGFPSTWRAGDKTGTGMARGMKDKYNDIAIAWPNAASPASTAGAPIIVAAFYETGVAHGKMRDEDQAVLASVGRIIATWASAGA
ncbi:MAG TPA: class A beta-lactamase [Casimicrobium sp.]|jgi:beta-lactamase class A|nr:class A beta-lactamase [Casimicrobium sp.]